VSFTLLSDFFCRQFWALICQYVVPTWQLDSASFPGPFWSISGSQGRRVNYGQLASISDLSIKLQIWAMSQLIWASISTSDNLSINLQTWALGQGLDWRGRRPFNFGHSFRTSWAEFQIQDFRCVTWAPPRKLPQVWNFSFLGELQIHGRLNLNLRSQVLPSQNRSNRFKSTEDLRNWARMNGTPPPKMKDSPRVP